MIKINRLKGYYKLKEHYYLNEDLKIVSKYDEVFELKSRLNSSGYVSYPLIRKDGKQMTVLLHRVIALAHIPNYNNYEEINHIDEDKLNNDIDNLEWCTRKYNCNYGNRIKKYSKKNMKPVAQIDMNGTVVEVHKGVIVATEKLGLKSKSAITNCIAGLSKSCCGFRWEYIG